MGFFSNLFKSSEDKEMEKIYKIIYQFLNNDELQNQNIPEFFEYLYKKGHRDYIQGARGEFGRCVTNPIPVNGVIGEITYLSKLLLIGTNEKIFFHRLGSCVGNVDLYQIVSLSGNFVDELYLDMYNYHKSNLVPQGYIMQKDVQGIRGIDSCSLNFPLNFYSDLLSNTKSIIGFPAIDTDAKFINIDNAIRNLNRFK